MSEDPAPEAAEAELHARISELTRELASERAARQASERAWIDALDSEQQRVAQLLHDTLSQTLNAARIHARVTRNTIQRTSPESSPALATLEEVIQSAADEFRELTRWLRPARLDGSDLIAALTELSELASGTTRCEFLATEGAIDAEPASQAELLRIAQRALHALVRHCGVQALELELELEEPHLVLQIRGSWERPLPPDLETLLQARARAMGGSFTVQHEAGSRSTLTCRLPKRR